MILMDSRINSVQSVHGDELGMCSKRLDDNKSFVIKDITFRLQIKVCLSHGKCTSLSDTQTMTDSLERLFNFTMSEIIFVGDERIL